MLSIEYPVEEKTNPLNNFAIHGNKIIKYHPPPPPSTTVVTEAGPGVLVNHTGYPTTIRGWFASREYLPLTGHTESTTTQQIFLSF